MIQAGETGNILASLWVCAQRNGDQLAANSRLLAGGLTTCRSNRLVGASGRGDSRPRASPGHAQGRLLPRRERGTA